MNYKHTTVKHSLEGLSPLEFVSELEEEGYTSLYSKLVQHLYGFLKRENPFDKYPNIKIITDRRLRYSEVVRLREIYGGYFLPDGPLPIFSSFGDLFKYKKNGDITYCIYDGSDETEKNLWFSCWSEKDLSLDEPLENFITTVFKVIGCDKSLQEIIGSDTFESAHNIVLGELVDYNLNEYSFSERRSVFDLLSREDVRNTLIDLSKKGNILLSDFLETVENKDKERKLLDFLVGQELLKKELIVICKETGQWWNITIPSIEKLKEIEELNLTCASCGSKISDEKIDELYKITDRAKQLVSGSKWMIGKVVNELIKYNVRENDIYVNITLNGEEIDIICFYLANILVFELKDREFGLGDAYRFHGKVSRLTEKLERRSIYPVIISTKTIASEANKLLEEVTSRRPINYTLIDSLESINQIKSELLDKIINDVINSRISNTKSKFPGILL